VVCANAPPDDCPIEATPIQREKADVFFRIFLEGVTKLSRDCRGAISREKQHWSPRSSGPSYLFEESCGLLGALPIHHVGEFEPIDASFGQCREKLAYAAVVKPKAVHSRARLRIPDCAQVGRHVVHRRVPSEEKREDIGVVCHWHTGKDPLEQFGRVAPR